MSDVSKSEMNPDDEPGERLQEALRGADTNNNSTDGKLPRSGADRRKNGPRPGDRRDRAATQ